MRRRGPLNVSFLLSWAIGVLVPLLYTSDAHAIETYEEMALIREWTLVRKVLLSHEHDGSGKNVSRWNISPVYYALAPKPHQKRLISDSITAVNEVLSGTGVKISLTFDPPGTADGVIVFLPKKDFAAGFKKVRCGAPDPAAAAAVCLSGLPDDDEILGASIMIDPSLKGDALKGAVLEEIYQSMGPVTDQDLFPDSVIFEDFYGGTNRTKLSAIDRKLLLFLYKHLKAGDDEATVRQKFDKYWQTIHVE